MRKFKKPACKNAVSLAYFPECMFLIYGRISEVSLKESVWLSRVNQDFLFGLIGKQSYSLLPLVSFLNPLWREICVDGAEAVPCSQTAVSVVKENNSSLFCLWSVGGYCFSSDYFCLLKLSFLIEKKRSSPWRNSLRKLRIDSLVELIWFLVILSVCLILYTVYVLAV